ncbi:MAG: hypothetical protein ISN28_06930 [Ectothiorhodospiraceae bacterium AqS1]|nr:hypothetical protein [Ectothiorhodospiraceae bacterium AqS1]
MIIRALFFPIVFFLAGMCFVGIASAATVVQVEFPDLVEGAEKIAVGEVRDIAFVHDAAQGGIPLTRVLFDSIEWWKGGEDERTITVEFLGGEMADGSMVEIPGSPKFRIGEKHLLFWKDGRQYVNPFVGWWQGHYKVDVNQAGKAVVQWPQRMMPSSPTGEGSGEGSGAKGSSLPGSHSHSHGGTTHSHALKAAIAPSKGAEPAEEVTIDRLKERVLSEMAK